MNKYFIFSILQFVFSFLCLEMQQLEHHGGNLWVDSPVFLIVGVVAAVIGIVFAFVGLMKRNK